MARISYEIFVALTHFWYFALAVFLLSPLLGIGLRLSAVVAALALLATVTSGLLAARTRTIERIHTNRATIFISICFTALLVGAVDRLLGPPPTDAPALPYPPNYSLRTVTNEFDYTLQTNALGFRRPENVATGPYAEGCRVLLLGDSFTEGYGNAYADTWGQLIENELEGVQLLNFGQGGQGPQSFEAIARIAIPLYRPDVVLLNLLQGDDLMQTLDPPADYPHENSTTSYLSQLFPNIARILTAQDNVLQAQSLKAARVAALLQRATPQQLQHYEANITREARQIYESGNLNPGLLAIALTTPDYFQRSIDLSHIQTRNAQLRLATVIYSLYTMSASAEFAVVSVPSGSFTSRVKLERYIDSGFLVNDPERMLSTTLMDDILQEAIAMSGYDDIPFITATNAFRAATASTSDALFYEWDGHFTPAGNRLFAATIIADVRRLCDADNHTTEDENAVL
jgi:hypothetical protein